AAPARHPSSQRRSAARRRCAAPRCWAVHRDRAGRPSASGLAERWPKAQGGGTAGRRRAQSPCSRRDRAIELARAMEGLAENVEQKLEGLPVTPGCYLFRDQSGGVLYVGKAKSLRARVRSYFQAGGSDTRAFIEFLPRLVFDLE